MLLGRRTLILFSAAMITSVLISPVSQASENAGAFVKELGDKAIRLLTVSDITEAEREDRFRSLLREGFDVERIGRFVLGRYARRANPDMIKEYHALFEDLIVATYASRFSEYSGQKFEIRRVAEPKDTGDAIVMSQIVAGSGSPVRVDWQVHGAGNNYKIVDVRVEGVSMSVTQREEFATVIRRNDGKVDALLEALRQKTSSLKSKSASR